jgi:cyclic beta-1,2-glucan synthetase
MYQMLNPFTHTESAADADVYKVEPFVIAADVYTAEGHLGRGGWTWYTGSASWAYRVGIEGILGVHKRGSSLVVEPCIPMAWGGFSVSYRVGKARYEVEVRNPEHVNRGVSTVTVDGSRAAGNVVPLVDDGKVHTVVVVLGDPA